MLLNPPHRTLLEMKATRHSGELGQVYCLRKFKRKARPGPGPAQGYFDQMSSCSEVMGRHRRSRPRPMHHACPRSLGCQCTNTVHTIVSDYCNNQHHPGSLGPSCTETSGRPHKNRGTDKCPINACMYAQIQGRLCALSGKGRDVPASPP